MRALMLWVLQSGLEVSARKDGHRPGHLSGNLETQLCAGAIMSSFSSG